MDVMLLIIAGVFIVALLVAFLIYQKNEVKQDKKRTTSNPTIPVSSKPKKGKSKNQRPKEQEDEEELKDATKKSKTRKKTDEAEDEMESVLEFLKGKDKSEIYKEANKQLKKEAKKKKKQQKVTDVEVADQSSEESGEGEYTVIEKKKAQVKSKDPINPAKQDTEKPYKKKKGSFFKADISKAMRDAEKKADKEKVREIKETHKEEAAAEHKGQEPEFKKEKEPKVFPPREPPKVSKEALDAPSLDDMLNSITKWYTNRAPASPSMQKDKDKDKEKDKDHINFSRLPRVAFDKILFSLEVKDLVVLSKVNKYFFKHCKGDPVWKALCERDLSVTERTQRSWKFTYKEEYNKTKSKILKKGEAKDHLERAWHTYFLECEDPKPIAGYNGSLARFTVEDVKRVIAICIRDPHEIPKKEDPEDEDDSEAIGVFELWDSRFVLIWAFESITKCRVASNYPTLMKYGITTHQRQQLKELASGIKIDPSQLVGSKGGKGESKAKVENGSKIGKAESSPKQVVKAAWKGENKPKAEKGSKAEAIQQK